MNHEVALHPGIFFAQVAYIVGGLFLLLSGVAIFYTIADWWLHGEHVVAVIVGIRRRGPQFYSVFRYVLSEGVVHEATSIQPGSSLQGRHTGRRVTIRVMAGEPDEAREAPGNAMWALAFGLFLGGVFLIYDAVISWKHSLIIWLFLALVALYVGRKVQRWFARFKFKTQSQVSDTCSATPIEAAESFGGSPQSSRIQVSGSAPGRSSVIFSIVGLIVLATASIPIHRLIQLKQGTKTEGTVIRLYSNMDSKNNGIYPDVQFTNAEGATVLFHDHVGANPSPYQVGDKVPVIYLPAKPDTAMIDRGLHNWGPVGGLLILGIILTGLGLFTMRGSTVSTQLRRTACRTETREHSDDLASSEPVGR